jgi:replication initiation and membrane attachment protein DnaB
MNVSEISKIPEHARAGKKVHNPGAINSLPSQQELDTICHEVEPPEEVDEFPQNPKLRRFRAKQLSEAEYIADCEFLRNIIKVLIDNHNISITPEDLQMIFGYWGEVVINTKVEHYTTRDPDVGCCGCSKAQQEKAVEVVKSILLNGLNVAKSLPDVVQFLGKLGIGF